MLFLRGMMPRLNLPVPVAVALLYILFVFPVMGMAYYELKSRRARARTPKGCRKLGLHDGHSNLHDEHEYSTDGRKPAQNTAKQDDTKSTPRIKALIAYPIKSCRGIEFNFTHFKDSGLAWDRRFCFAEYTADEKDDGEGHWDAKTLRNGTFSRLALVRPEIWIPNPTSPGYDKRLHSVKSDGVLLIFYPRDTSRLPPWTRLGIKLGLLESEEWFSIPLNPPPPQDSSTYPLEELRLFSIPTRATRYSTHVPASLAEFLGSKKPLGLFRVHSGHVRVAVGNAPSERELGYVPDKAFSDEYPLQMQSMGSLRDMHGRTKYAIPQLSVRRFRPNVVVERVRAYEEDAWKMIRFVSSDKGEGVDVHVCCRTVRCKLPNVDPDTGERHAVEPDKTLRGTRVIDAGGKGGCLGMMLVPSRPGKSTLITDLRSLLGTDGCRL